MFLEVLNMSLGESIIRRIQVQLGYNRFKEGREDVNDGARSGRPNASTTDEDIEAVKKIILDNLRITITLLMMLAYRLGNVKKRLRLFS